jgi:hypothetical protein
MMDSQTGQIFKATDEELELFEKRLGSGEGKRFFNLPHKGDPECGKCKGRGTVKSYGTRYAYAPCPKCFPNHGIKAVSFKEHLKRNFQRRERWNG